MTSIAITLKNTALALQKVSHSPRLDAEILLCHCLGKSKSHLYAHPDEIIGKAHLHQFQNDLTQRLNKVPIAYIVGYKEFWSLNFDVSTNTLIPRPETELLVELTLQLLEKKQKATVLDLGTGSGAIAIALAHERPNWHISACDNSQDALKCAKNNAKKHQIDNIEFIHSNWFDKISCKHFDAIISNPPYIAKDCPYLEDHVIAHEPQNALISANNGLNDLEHIILNSSNYLVNGGLLILEHGHEQQTKLIEIMANNRFECIEGHHDLADHPRAVTGKLKKLSL
jgi:release factor glutamine methyltransferase